MTFRSSHIYNDYMNRQHKVRQADTQYARIKIRRVNQHYSKFYWSGNKGISTKSKYSQFNKYKNKYKKNGYHAWTVWHIEQLPVQNVMKDKTYTYKINNDDADKDIVDTSKTKTTKATNTTSGTQKTQKTTTTTTSNNTTITITKDVSYEGKPKTTRDVLTMTRKKKDYGVMEITYYAPENGWYNFEVLYGATVDCKLDNNFYIDNKLQKKGRDWTGYREVMNRHINHIKLEKGTHTITWKFDSRTIIYALGVKKIEVFEADTFNEKPLTLYNFDLSKTDELNTLEATVNLFVEPFMFDKGKPYYIEENYSNLLFDYRDELNIYAKDNTGKERQLFGGYISSISLDDDGMIMELKCADRLIDLQNKYNLTQLNYNGGNNDDSKKEYTLSKQRYFIKYGDVLDFLTESVEVPLKNNVNDKTGTVFGEAVKDTGFHVSFNDDKTHFKKIKDTAKNMEVSTDSSNTKTRTKYMQLRNKPEVNKHQEVTLFNYDNLTNKQGLNAYCINKNPYLTVKYAMGDPKSTYKVCTSTSEGDYSQLTGNFQNRASQLVQGITSTSEKAKAIFNYCKTAFSYESYSNFVHKPDDVINRKKANCCDSARVFVEMVRSVGIQAGYCHGTATFSDGTFNHVWAYFVNDSGNKIWVDVGRELEQWDCKGKSGYPANPRFFTSSTVIDGN